MSAYPQTARNRVKRLPERADYDQETVYQILDEALICHVGFAIDNQPFVIPTIHARRDNTLLLHGATTSRLLKHLEAGNPICVTTTLLDGLVIARGVFHNSMNYRSVVLFGKAHILDDPDEKYAALHVLTNRLMPGRWEDARLPTANEMKATTIVDLPIESATAKIRVGPPKDDAEDYDLDLWAGVLPIVQTVQAPVNDPKLKAGVRVPEYFKGYTRG